MRVAMPSVVHQQSVRLHRLDEQSSERTQVLSSSQHAVQKEQGRLVARFVHRVADYLVGQQRHSLLLLRFFF